MYRANVATSRAGNHTLAFWPKRFKKTCLLSVNPDEMSAIPRERSWTYQFKLPPGMWFDLWNYTSPPVLVLIFIFFNLGVAGKLAAQHIMQKAIPPLCPTTGKKKKIATDQGLGQWSASTNNQGPSGAHWRPLVLIGALNPILKLGIRSNFSECLTIINVFYWT